MDFTLVDDVELDRRVAEEAQRQLDIQAVLRDSVQLQFAPTFVKVEPAALIHWV